jgi:hypothetical protein
MFYLKGKSTIWESGLKGVIKGRASDLLPIGWIKAVRLAQSCFNLSLRQSPSLSVVKACLCHFNIPFGLANGFELPARFSVLTQLLSSSVSLSVSLLFRRAIKWNYIVKINIEMSNKILTRSVHKWLFYIRNHYLGKESVSIYVLK